jgi:hypothetical protein
LKAKNTMQQECRNRDMRNRDLNQPSDQEMIWTVDLTSLRSFGDRDLEVTKTHERQEFEFRDMRNRESAFNLNRQIKKMIWSR